jgi:hypothetical protein
MFAAVEKVVALCMDKIGHVPGRAVTGRYVGCGDRFSFRLIGRVLHLDWPLRGWILETAALDLQIITLMSARRF